MTIDQMIKLIRGSVNSDEEKKMFLRWLDEEKKTKEENRKKWLKTHEISSLTVNPENN